MIFKVCTLCKCKFHLVQMQISFFFFSTLLYKAKLEKEAKQTTVLDSVCEAPAHDYRTYRTSLPVVLRVYLFPVTTIVTLGVMFQRFLDSERISKLLKVSARRMKKPNCVKSF